MPTLICVQSIVGQWLFGRLSCNVSQSVIYVQTRMESVNAWYQCGHVNIS